MGDVLQGLVNVPMFHITQNYWGYNLIQFPTDICFGHVKQIPKKGHLPSPQALCKLAKNGDLMWICEGCQVRECVEDPPMIHLYGRLEISNLCPHVQ